MSDDYRIEQLEKDVTEVKKDIKDIMRNHLPHLGKELSGLKSRVSIFGLFNIRVRIIFFFRLWLLQELSA